MVCTRHMFSVRLACTLTLPLQVGILQSPLSVTFLFFNFIMGLLLGLHASPAVSSFQDAPKAPLGDDPPAIEQIVAIAPIAGRDRGDDRCCRRSLKALTKRLSTTLLPATTRGDIPKQRDRRSASAVASQVGRSSVPSCACMTAFASPQRTPTLMQLVCCVVSPVSTGARLSFLLPTSETQTDSLSRTKVLNSRRETAGGM